MKNLIETIKKHWIVSTGLTVLLVAIFIAIFLVLNLWVHSLNLTAIDFTKEKIYSLTEESKSQLKSIDKEVKIYLLGYGSTASIVDLIHQYGKTNDKITCEVIESADNRPDLTSTYQLTTTPAIIIASENQSKVLYPSDLESYDYTSGESIDLSEQKLTNGILNVTTDNRPVIYFLSGHNEYSLDQYLAKLKGYMEEEAYTVKTLNLLVNQSIPEDCSTLAIFTPSKDFSDFEVEKLIEYIQNGGNILWLNDVNFTNETYPNIQKILDLYGTKFDTGIVLEQDSNHIALQSPNYLFPASNSTSDITKTISSEGSVLMVNSCRLAIADDEILSNLNVTANNLLTTTDQALFRTNLENTSTKKISGDEEGTQILGAQFEKKINDTTSSKLVIYANNQFATDVQLATGDLCIDIANNKDLILNSIADLTNRTDTITIRKDTQAVSYTATQTQHNIIMAIIFLLPIVVILIGIILWQVRRRKK